MVVLNFTCLEKKKALEEKTVCQTIRTSVDKFFQKGHRVMIINSKEIGRLEGVESIEVIESSFGRKELHVHVKEKRRALLAKIYATDKEITSHYPYFIGSTVFGKDVDEPEATPEVPESPGQSSLGTEQ